MKRARFTIILLIAILTTAALCAQSDSMSVTVTFPFVVGNTPMPAGQYFFAGIYQSAVAIQHAKGKVGIILMTQRTSRQPSELPKLVFHRYGNRYFLTSVLLPNSDYGRAFATSKEEIELAKLQKRQPDVEVGR